MNGAHIHLLLNHIPVIGSVFGFLLLLIAIVRKSEELKKVGLGILIVIAVGTILVYFSGESAEEIIEDLPGVSERIIEKHEDFALISFISTEVVGGIALLGFLLFRRKKNILNNFLLSILVLSFISSTLIAWTANLGGQIRHTEIRKDSQITPEYKKESEKEENKTE